MTKPLIHFNEPQFAFHQRMTLLCAQAYSKIIVSNINILNYTPGPGQEIGAVLVNIESILKNVLKLSPEFHQQASMHVSTPMHQLMFSLIEGRSLNKEEVIAQYYNGLHTNYVKSMTLCSYIILTLEKFKDTLQQENSQAYHEVMAYYTLFASILAYNAIILNRDFQSSAHVKPLLDSIHTWMFLLESACLTHRHDPIFHQLHQIFVDKFNKLKSQMSKDATSLALLPSEIGFHVNRKNERARLNGSSYSARVVLKYDSLHLSTVDSDAIQRFVTAIEDLPRAPYKRQQILFYPGHFMGEVEPFDVEWDENEGVFNLIYVHAGCSSRQYQLLQELKYQLENKHIPYRILACQADIQHQGTDSSAMLAYAFSGLLSHHSFNKLKQSTFITNQPTFYDYRSPEGQHLTKLDNVTWFNVAALGPKAVMMANPSTPAQYQTMLSRLSAIVPQEELPGVLQIFRKKYQVQNDPDKSNPHHFVDNFRTRLRHRAQGEPFLGLSLEDVMQQLGASNPGQAMRRAAAGMVNVDTFEFMLAQFSSLSLDNNPINAADTIPEKGFTPLHLCFQEKYLSPTKAVKLLRAHARSDIQDAHQQTAQDLYEFADDASAIKKNPVLGTLLKRQ